MFIVIYQFYGENALHKICATESEARIVATQQKRWNGCAYADIYRLGEMLK